LPTDYKQLLDVWEKPEAFFIFLAKERKFEVRLKLWKFLLDFEPKAALMKSQLQRLSETFLLIKDNSQFHLILSKILTIGNILNAGNVKRGQADGFMLPDAFNKVTMLRDIEG